MPKLRHFLKLNSINYKKTKGIHFNNYFNKVNFLSLERY
jgi:hypothetical protein